MKRSSLAALLAILIVSPAFVNAQTSFPPSSSSSQPIPVTHVAKPATQKVGSSGPFSHWALGGGVSPLGINMLVATNLSHRFDLRGTGNIFRYNINDIDTNGFTIDAKLNLASAGAALDIYPFGRLWRVSPGVMFYNGNEATGNITVAAGTSFELNDQTYYSSSTTPVTGTATLNLHQQKPAFTITTGFGRIVGETKHHLSFPFELGVAMNGAPKMAMDLSGYACDATGINCVNVATTTEIQSNLKAQINSYNSDLDPLRFYPIISFGVAYSFAVR